MKWSILIATLARREDKLGLLLADLAPQIDKAGGQVEIVAYRNNGEHPLAHIRQSLVESAVGEYISFVDDDDRVPEYYVSEVLPLLDGVDYIGFRMQAYLDGVPYKPTFHSLRYAGWSEDADGFYRDTSHLNPVRTVLARQCDFRRTDPPEDVAWADQLRDLAITEHYIDRVMYHYYSSAHDSAWRPGHENPSTWTNLSRPTIDVTNFRWHQASL
jgi:hypothetical protein